MKPLLAMISVFAFVSWLGCDSIVDSKSCTEVGCGSQGVSVDFRFTEKGLYTFEVSLIDDKGLQGPLTKCQLTLPLPQGIETLGPCDRTTDLFLRIVGSRLPADQQSIDGISVTSTQVKTVKVKATRDGVVLGDKSIDVTYTVTPGPNGPDCEPKECRSASATFP